MRLFAPPIIPLTLALAGLAGCSVSGVTTGADTLELPAAWARDADPGAVTGAWLPGFADSRLEALVAEAAARNFVLRQESERVEVARQAVVVARAGRLPVLDIGLDGARRSVETAGGGSQVTDSYDIALGGRWEIDPWRRLAKRQQAAELALAAQEARLASLARDVAAAATAQYFDVLAATQLLGVAERRLANAVESRDIVASGYRQGLNDALDLYLARNQVERERANVAQQEQARLEAIADLQLTLARYPDGLFDETPELPVLDEPIPAGLPSGLLSRRPDLQEAWLSLLAADAELAAAHRARFPSLSLSGSAGRVSTGFSELVSDGAAAWSLAFGLTQPLFEAGRLAAQQEQALARVRIAEQAYLDLAYRAFAEVENALSRAASLEERYEALLEAEKNSRAALELALEQYQRGLVTYTTVLESQRQAFDAEATVVELKNQRLQNRVALHLALGGEFLAATP